MYTAKFHTAISGGRLFINLPKGFPEGEAEVIVQVETEHTLPTTSLSLAEFSAWLKTRPRIQRTAEDFAAQIAEERAAWGDEQ